MKLSQVFTKTRNILAANGYGYICMIIEFELPDVPLRDRNRALELIRIRMGYADKPHLTVPSLRWWLIDHGHATENELPNGSGGVHMQEYRLRWLDALIKEFEAKEASK